MPFIGKSVTFEGVLSQSSEFNAAGGYQLTPVLPVDLRYVSTGVWDSITVNQYTLFDNYPNPFSYSTTIQYSLENANFVSLKVYNVLGNEVTTLVNSFKDAGSYTATFSIDDNALLLSNCVYFYRLKVGTFVSTKQMILVK